MLGFFVAKISYKLSGNLTFIHILIRQYTGAIYVVLLIINFDYDAIWHITDWRAVDLYATAYLFIIQSYSVVKLLKSSNDKENPTIKNREYIMSTTDNDTSDIKKAVDQVNSQEIEKNLKDSSKTDAPEQLSEEEQTPFIDDALRTDK